MYIRRTRTIPQPPQTSKNINLYIKNGTKLKVTINSQVFIQRAKEMRELLTFVMFAKLIP